MDEQRLAEAEYWEARYRTQHRTVHRLEDALRSERERTETLREALEWYAERRNYAPAGGESAYDALMARDSFDDFGPGARARSALALSKAAPAEE